MAMRHVLAEACDAYAQQARQPVDVVAVGGVDAMKRVQRGEAFDFVVLASEAIDRLAASGHVDAATRADLARSEIAVAVASGAPRPDIGSEAAVRDAVSRARTIGYSTGPSGDYLMRLFAHWGIAETLASRLVQAPPGTPVGTLIARGDVDLGLQQSSELMHLPGVDIVGPLPSGIQQATVFSGAACTASQDIASANALLSFLASPAADDAKRRHGMAPIG
ncbi:MAG TPA: substrate-binding domain-containing protein [Casimicrobiaceae bacterium]|jgi:molybdate transport system substrate-binding protein|nr:substrate-binding domain-containing protein [Casimicrobiaceae bacterium]